MDKAFGDIAFKQRDGIILDNEMFLFCVLHGSGEVRPDLRRGVAICLPAWCPSAKTSRTNGLTAS
jgi:hypothetical protein